MDRFINFNFFDSSQSFQNLETGALLSIFLKMTLSYFFLARLFKINSFPKELLAMFSIIFILTKNQIAWLYKDSPR